MTNIVVPFKSDHVVSQSAISNAVYRYYNKKRDDRNQRQAGDTMIVHHHFGLGDLQIDLDVATQDEITSEIQRLESNLTNHILMLLNPNCNDTILDLGCGRGGNMITIAKATGATIVGSNLSEYQAEYCKKAFEFNGVSDKCRVDINDFTNLPYDDNSFSAVYSSEITEYVFDLVKFFAGINRTMAVNGKFVIATWCYDKTFNENDLVKLIDPINLHYASTIHPSDEYLSALKESGFDVVHLEDRSKDFLPYWHLRKRWNDASGIEDSFIEGHTNGMLKYLFITAKKRGC
jgi:geranyl diphosphate 2-C-methyltransferase